MQDFYFYLNSWQKGYFLPLLCDHSQVDNSVHIVLHALFLNFGEMFHPAQAIFI